MGRLVVALWTRATLGGSSAHCADSFTQPLHLGIVRERSLTLLAVMPSGEGEVDLACTA